jgi:oligopeptidase B
MPQPTAKQVPHVWHRPTGDVDDPWAWLRDRDDPDTVAYLEAENRYADAWFAPHRELTHSLFEEIKSRVQETDVAVPVRKDGWWYTARTEEGLNYAIHCRGTTRETATEQVLLDENVEATGADFFSLGLFEISPDHALAAWSSDVDGSELYTLHIRDLSTGADLDDVLSGTSA